MIGIPDSCEMCVAVYVYVHACLGLCHCVRYICICVSVCACVCCLIWSKGGANIGCPRTKKNPMVETSCHFLYVSVLWKNKNCEWGIPRWKSFVNCFLIWNTMGYSCWQVPQVCSEVLMKPFLHQNKMIVSQGKAINCVLLATPTLSFSLVNLEGWWEGRERRNALNNQIALHIFTFCSWLISG